MDCVCWRSTDLCPIYSAPACDSPEFGSISSLIVGLVGEARLLLTRGRVL